MFLTRLKYWRELRGYSVRQLAEKSGVGFTTISFLENIHRRPHGITVRKLATALDVEVADLYGPEPKTEALIAQAINDKETIKNNKLTWAKKQLAGNFWISDEDGDVWGPFIKAEADKLKEKLGRARVYEAASKNDARELHRQFLTRVARGA